MAKPIQAIIFDCFGVLVTESWLSFKKEHFGHDPALSEKATKLLQQADGGMLSHEEFIAKIAVLAGIKSNTVKDYLDKNSPNEELFNYISKELKIQYKIGMLSNAAADWLAELFSKEQLALFDAIALSFTSGMTKPNEGAYLNIAKKLGVDPNVCVFVDDQKRHCAGARDAGMQAILYEDFEQMKRELTQLLSI